jgi:hypothetical protein
LSISGFEAYTGSPGGTEVKATDVKYNTKITLIGGTAK